MPVMNRVNDRRGLNTSQAIAFRYCVSVLEADQNLRRIGCVIETHEGDPDTADIPTSTDRPFISLLPQAEPYDYNAAYQIPPSRVSVRTPVLVSVLTSQTGARWDNTVNLWDLIANALVPHDSEGMASRVAEWHENCVTDIEFVDPADIPAENVAEGAFRIVTYSWA